MGGRRRAKPLTKAAQDLAVNITYHRHQADMTRKDFAKKLGISVQYLWELSECMANPTLELMESIADTLKVPVSSLLEPRAHTSKPEDFEPDNDLIERRRTGRKKKPKILPPASIKKVLRKA